MRSLLVLLVLALVLGAAGAHAAPSDREVYIYRGAPASDSGITVGSWGSGKAIESKEKVLAGSQSIKITTQGFYSGGRIDFAQPVTLFTDGIDPKRYMVFSFFFNDVQVVDPAAGTNYWFDVEPYTVPKASKMRFVLISDTGLSVSAVQSTNPVDPDDNWVRVAVPLAKFNLPEGINEFRLKRLLVFSDAPGTLSSPAVTFLGEIKMVTDNQPIRVDSLGGQVVAVYDDVFFVANAQGGVSSLKYSWDYDAGNGIQEETTGPVGRYMYTRGGDFTVTLTVTDTDGLKTPVSVRATVSVND